jgi:2-polyprenyl-3-methyl-5-hydroxy-6-metoxy-1,4-benzoquinol methylase
MGIPAKLKYMVSGATGRISRSPCCPSCRSCRSEQLDRKYFHALLLCSECKLLYRFPGENPEEMTAFYEDDYAESGLTTELPSDAELRVLIDTGFRGSPKDFSYHIEILRALGLTTGSRLLDFGANWGYSTWQFQKAGFSAEGFEPSRTRAAFGRKLGLDICTDASKLRPIYDAVYSCHVLEHVPDPTATLYQQLSMVREGGLVVAHTPNGSAAYRQHHSQAFHRMWGQVHPVLLNDGFVAKACAQYRYLITSDDRPEEVRKWDQSSQMIKECSQSGFFFAVKKGSATASGRLC